MIDFFPLHLIISLKPLVTDTEPVSKRKKKKNMINKCLQSHDKIREYLLVFSYANSLLDELGIFDGSLSGCLANLFGQQWGKEAGGGFWGGREAVMP